MQSTGKLPNAKFAISRYLSFQRSIFSPPLSRGGPTTHCPHDFPFTSLFSQFFSLSSSWELCPQGERRDPVGRHGEEADRLPLPSPSSLPSLFPLSSLPSLPLLHGDRRRGGAVRQRQRGSGATLEAPGRGVGRGGVTQLAPAGMPSAAARHL